MPNMNSVSMTIQAMFDVGVGTVGSMDSFEQYLKSLNGQEVMTIVTNGAQVTASVVSVAAFFGLAGVPLVVSASLVSVTLTITKNLLQEPAHGVPGAGMNVGDILNCLGNIASVAGAGLPAGTIAAVGFSVAGGTFGIAGLLENGLPGGLQGLIGKVQGLFGSASSARSPLILDLDGDGIETLSSTTSGIHFDHDGNRFAEQTGWVGADDGLLVLDRNSDGRIGSGAELFGNYTVISSGSTATNGFTALADLDTNHDGKVDASDTAFTSLRIWKDANSDGQVQDGELITLADAGVASLNTGYTTSTTVDANGNAHKQVGSFTRANGTSGAMNDVWFQVDTARTIDLEQVEESEAIQALPDMQGLGNVHSLRQAMARDAAGALQTAVEQFAAAQTQDERLALMNGMGMLVTNAANESQFLMLEIFK